MSDADDARQAAIREFELAQARKRVELQERELEALRRSLARNAPAPRTATIGPAPDEAARARRARLPAPATLPPGWPTPPMPKTKLPAPAGRAAHSLTGSTAKTVAFAVFGLSGDALEQAVANVAERQRAAMDFIPLFLTDATDTEAFRRRGYVFEYFPKAAYGALADAGALQERLRALWKKWGVGSLIDIGAAAPQRTTADRKHPV